MVTNSPPPTLGQRETGEMISPSGRFGDEDVAPFERKRREDVVPFPPGAGRGAAFVI